MSVSNRAIRDHIVHNLNNERGHGYISLKDLLKIGAIIVTFPVSVPVLMIKDKIKKKKDK